MDWDELTYMGETIELDGDSLEQFKPTYWRRTNEQTASHQHAAREAAQVLELTAQGYKAPLVLTPLGVKL